MLSKRSPRLNCVVSAARKSATAAFSPANNTLYRTRLAGVTNPVASKSAAFINTRGARLNTFPDARDGSLVSTALMRNRV